ncbi:MAG: VPLPA-CTERM sorting domain-containing protein [Boseongicola sp.]
MKLTRILTAAALAVVMPLAASAATLVMTDGGSYGLSEADLFTYNADLNDSYDNGVVSFDFTNDLGGAVELLATTTVNANGGGSDPDATGGFGDEAVDLADGSFNMFSIDLANLASTTFFVRLGDVTEPYNLDVQVRYITAVPVPAAGFLLIGALGGLVGLRRRKA